MLAESWRIFFGSTERNLFEKWKLEEILFLMKFLKTS